MEWIYHVREARVIYSLTTDRRPVSEYIWHQIACYQDSISILTHKKRGEGDYILQLFPVFRRYMKRNPTKNLTVIVEAFTCISEVFDARKRRYTV